MLTQTKGATASAEICFRQMDRIITRTEASEAYGLPGRRWLWLVAAVTVAATMAAMLLWQQPGAANYALTILLLASWGILAFTAASHALALGSRFQRNVLYVQEVERNYESLWQVVFSALDLRDQVTGGHSSRVAHLALRLGQRLGMSAEQLQHLEWAAHLHDVGKMAVPDAILNKPGPLSPDEWQQMRLHPAYGHSIAARDTFLKQAAELIYCHHERFDGGGYPRGLAGEQIPLGARVFAVADAYDSMTSDRPYRRALPHSQAMEEIERNAGSQFDPDVVAALVELAEPVSCSAPPEASATTDVPVGC